MKQEEWIKQFQQDMEKIDSIEPYVPDSQYLLETINEFKWKRKRAFYKELIAFLLTAVFIMTLYVTIAFNLPQVFIWIQIIAFLAIPMVIFFERKRRKKQVDHYGF